MNENEEEEEELDGAGGVVKATLPRHTIQESFLGEQANNNYNNAINEINKTDSKLLEPSSI